MEHGQGSGMARVGGNVVAFVLERYINCTNESGLQSSSLQAIDMYATLLRVVITELYIEHGVSKEGDEEMRRGHAIHFLGSQAEGHQQPVVCTVVC